MKALQLGGTSLALLKVAKGASKCLPLKGLHGREGSLGHNNYQNQLDLHEEVKKRKTRRVHISSDSKGVSIDPVSRTLSSHCNVTVSPFPLSYLVSKSDKDFICRACSIIKDYQNISCDEEDETEM